MDTMTVNVMAHSREQTNGKAFISTEWQRYKKCVPSQPMRSELGAWRGTQQEPSWPPLAVTSLSRSGPRRETTGCASQPWLMLTLAQFVPLDGLPAGTTWLVPALMPRQPSGVGKVESLSALPPWRVMKMRSRPLPGLPQAA